MPHPRDDQYISFSSTESPVEDADMESGAVALPASQVECQELRKGLTRLPADTPRTPGPKSVDFQQFCDRLRTDSALSLYWRQGASAFPLAMCARLCWCALAVGVALGSLHDNEPMQADEPPIYAGMSLVGCLLLVGKKCSRPMGLNVLGGQEVRFSSTGCHRLMVSSIGRRGIGWWPRLTSGQMNLSMTSLAGLTTSGAGGQMRSGGSKGFMKRELCSYHEARFSGLCSESTWANGVGLS